MVSIQKNLMLNVISCRDTLKHIGNVCNLENEIDDWCTSLRIKTYFDDGIGTSGGTMIDGGNAGRTRIVMSHGIWISSWSGSCDICCGNGFSGSSVNLGDYCCCCGGSCGYGGAQSLNDPER